MKILGVIPARYASSRFPAKPLAEIAGKAMVEWVYSQAVQWTSLQSVVVATDHEKIYNHLIEKEINVCMTSSDHVSGTDRCQEALIKSGQVFDYVVNIQGDEPFISPRQIDLLTSLLNGTVQLATLKKKITQTEHLFSPHVVKVVTDQHGNAMYFSRSPIPHIRHIKEADWLKAHSFFKHIGMYAYRADVLRQITALAPSTLEKAESLEQLRWIENGFALKVAETDIETLGVDTPEDLIQANNFVRELGRK